MMDHLLAVSRELGPQLRDRLGHLGDRVRGAMVGVDPYWLGAAALAAVGTWGSGSAVAGWSAAALLRMFQRLYLQDAVKLDWKYRPPGWTLHCQLTGYHTDADPLHFIVILRAGQGLTLDLPVRIQNHPIRYEYRATCRALVEIGQLKVFWNRHYELSIGRARPDTAGTLGGFLRCPASGRQYAVSCRHVMGPEGTPVSHPGPYEGRQSVPIGHVAFSELADPAPPGTVCNAPVMPTARRLDLAVAELSTDVGSLFPGADQELHVDTVRPIAKLASRQLATFRGKVSGVVPVELGHVTIWDNVEIDGRLHCFGGLFTIRPRRPYYLNTDLCRSGDSGAWVVGEDEGVRSWYGMLIAGDGAEAYCCFAQDIVEACRQRFPSGLAPL